MNKVYEIITDKIIEQLEKGVIPWKKSWSAGGLPKNGISNKEYNGINPFLLLVKGYNNPNWFTFKQIQDIGGNVRKGEKATMVIFWKKFTPATISDKEEEENKEHLVLRYYNTFNALQCEGLPDKYYPKNNRVFNPIDVAEKIVKGYQNAPGIVHEEQRAYYRPSTDVVNMPRPESFSSEISYYQTLFHELTHSTGHENRLNRLSKDASFGSQDYSKEELVAEMGASFLSGRAEIFNDTQLEQASAYIQGWLKALKNDKMLVVKAAASAQKAADYITSA
jgi:antirestriction protein ArdC